MHRKFVTAINSALVHLLYRRTVTGLQHIPKEGGALLVINHIALSDPAVIMATIPRPIRFLMYRPFYEHTLVHQFVKPIGAIPIAAEDSPKALVAALSTAREALKNGECVAIFAEGELTRIGNLLPFGKGLEKIMKGIDNVPIIPIHLDAMWGSFFSHRDGKPLKKLPGRFPRPITITIGAPLPSHTRANEVRDTIADLGSRAFAQRALGKGSLGGNFIQIARKYPLRKAIVDSNGQQLTYFTLLGVALQLARKLKKLKIVPEEMVGVLLPPSAASAILNLALTVRGAIPINLNYTVGSATLEATISACNIRTIITAQAMCEKISLPSHIQPTMVEELFANSAISNIIHALLGKCTPYSLLSSLFSIHSPRPQDIATVLFSSGSTGTPKGVLLTHHNILANVTSLSEVFQLQHDDGIVGVLPFFHSFGFTATLWLPLLSGIKALYHKNPIDASAVGDLTEKHGGTILLTTPTFLTAYIRKLSKEKLHTLRHVVAGAEKLSDRLSTAFQEKFGVTPMEGYGCTELSPVAMLNVRNYIDENVTQIGHKPGTVGHPIPGVTAKVVDPELFVSLPPNTEGLLLIKGPNVMKGYLNDPGRTAEVMRGEWYVTGDIAKIDESGFVTITDRLSRFSKIGGEMVPHGGVEEAIHKVLGKEDQVCVVTSVPHPSKGEQLVVLHTIAFDSKEICAKLSEMGLANLWIPKRENFYSIETLPLLGSGKLDLKKIKELAKSLTSEQS